MTGISEARYIQVIWQDRTTAKKIVASRDCLRLEPVDDTTVVVEVVSYSRIDDGSAGQFAIRLDGGVLAMPCVELGNGIWIDLLPVTDPVSGTVWWVEGKTWDRQRGRWLSDIYRGTGEVLIRIGDRSCRVRVSASTFTHQELERYLRDFQTDFWELILDETSYLTAAAKRDRQNLLDRETLGAITKFIECVDLVLRNPKAELREVQRPKPRREVRPVPRTFMEMAMRGSSRTLASRDYEESMDVPENRYAHHALRKVYQITRALHTVCTSQARSLERSLEGQRQRLSGLSGMRTINRDAVMHDLEDRKKMLLDLESTMSGQNSRLADLVRRNAASRQWAAHEQDFQGRRIGRLLIHAGRRADGLPGRPFFARIRSSDLKPWYEFSDGYATVDAGVFSSAIEEGSEYEAVGDIDYTITCRNDRSRHNFAFLSLSEFRLTGSDRYEKLVRQLEDMRQKIHRLESGGWERALTGDEIEQQKREAASIEKVIDLVVAKQGTLASLGADLQPKLSALRAALTLFEGKKVRPDARFPGSMSYIQNPAYQGLHGAFLKIREGAGVSDDDILLAIDRIDEIGLVNVSMLYERWCLLQIIRILFRFRYQPEPGWKRRLITQILDQGRNVSIRFEHPGLGRSLTLAYEMELESGRRPDFILDVTLNGHGGEAPVTKRFVMDAKFYQDIKNARHGGLGQVVNELYNEKDYAEGGRNMVFILHPSRDAAPVRATPQDWSRDSYYGEVRLFDWSPGSPDHRYGGIYLSPAAGGSYLDSLQRAIGMFLQYGVENNDITEAEYGALPEHGLFCLACGSSEVRCRQSPNNARAWWSICSECRHFATYNHCRECGNRLVKNGEYWSYHAMEPLNPTNIKCPSCAGLL